MTDYLIQRKDVSPDDQWCLEDIFATHEDFFATLKQAEKDLTQLKTYEGKLTTQSDVLFTFLQAQDAFWIAANKLYVYAHMRLHEDGNQTYYQDLSQKSEVFSIKASSLLAFVQPELSTLTPELLDTFYHTTPELKRYARYFHEILRQKEHILDPGTEALLAEVSDLAGTSSNAFAMFNNVDLKFPQVHDAKGNKVPLTHASYLPLMESPLQEVRKEAFFTLYETYGQFKNTLATLFAGNIKQYAFMSNRRHFPSALEMALSENNIPSHVYQNLIQTVNGHLGTLHHYMALRKDVLGLDTLHMYDLFVPMVKDYDKAISFDEAQSTVIKALAPLGQEYLDVVLSAFKEGWIDKYENAGKRSGAYSWGTYGAPHPYILLNHTSNLNSMFTLAHEMGHAMHTYYSHKTQSPMYGDYCIFVAEVASTVNEALLMQHLLKQATDPLEKQYLLNYFMDQFKSTLYRQTMFAEFEYTMHTAYQEGHSLTSDYLSQHYLELVKKYHGPNVVVDEAISLEWARIPHFYTPFYVYQYATGYSAAIALSQRILEEGQPAVDDYLRFLSGGSSMDPIDLLKLAGVSMDQSTPIESALSLFEQLISDYQATR